MSSKALLLAAPVLLASAALADEVELVTGEVLKGSNVVQEAGRVKFDHPVLGRIDLDASRVRGVRRDGASDLAAAIASMPAGTGGDDATGAPAKAPQWKFRIEVGVNGTSGNTRTQDIHLGGGALLEQEEHRWKFDAQYARSKNAGVKTKDQWYVQGLKDWMWKDSPWIAFVTGRYDADKFQEWDKRISLGAGAGYKLVDEADLKVRLRAGLNETKESGSDSDQWRTEGLLGADMSWKINDSQNLEASVTYYPDFRDSPEYRVVGSVAWSIKLSQTEALSLKIGVQDEYDSHREKPFKKNDLKYYAAILYEF